MGGQDCEVAAIAPTPAEIKQLPARSGGGRVGRHRPRPRRTAGRRPQDESLSTPVDQSVEELLAMMAGAADSPEEQAKGCGALRQKAAGMDGQNEVGVAGIEAVMKAMHHPAAVVQGMCALEKITTCHTKNTLALVEKGGIQAVLQAMTGHSQATLQEVGCKIICNATTCNAECQAAVINLGAVKVVLDALRAHAPVAAIQEQGCRALKELAAYNSESQDNIYAEGGIQVVLRAMENHPQIPNIQVMGCGVLRNLAASNSMQQEAIISRGGVQLVLDAMKAHTVANVQWAGCWTLFCLCVHNKEMQAEVSAYGAVRAAVHAMEMHRAEGRIQEASSWLLKELAEPTSHDTTLFSAALQATLKAVEKHPMNHAVQKATKAALQQFAAHDTDGWVRTACLGRCGRLGRTATMRTLEAIQE